MILMRDLLGVHTVRLSLQRRQHAYWRLCVDDIVPVCRDASGMFKSCAIASDDEETRNEGCLRLAKALRDIVTAEQDLQAKNAAHESGIVGKAAVSENVGATQYLEHLQHLEYVAGSPNCQAGRPKIV